MITEVVTREVKEVETRVVTVTCDVCGRHSYDRHNWFDPNGWECRVTHTQIKSETGYNRPMDGEIDFLEADICTDCFKNRVVPALEAIGVKFRERHLSI